MHDCKKWNRRFTSSEMDPTRFSCEQDEHLKPYRIPSSPFYSIIAPRRLHRNSQNGSITTAGSMIGSFRVSGSAEHRGSLKNTSAPAPLGPLPLAPSDFRKRTGLTNREL